MAGTNGQKRRYDREFKREAIRLVEERGKSTTVVAEDLGIHPNLLHTWRRRYRENPEHSFPGKGHLPIPAERERTLQRELDRVTRERDILKKALAIFSKGPPTVWYAPHSTD